MSTAPAPHTCPRCGQSTFTPSDEAFDATERNPFGATAAASPFYSTEPQPLTGIFRIQTGHGTTIEVPVRDGKVQLPYSGNLVAGAAQVFTFPVTAYTEGYAALADELRAYSPTVAATRRGGL